MRTFPTITLFASVFVAFALLPDSLSARSNDVYALLFDEIRVQQQIGFGFQFQERREEDNVYQRTRQIALSGEWAPVSWFSIFLKVPYADLVHTDRGKVDYWEHIRLGLKFEGGWQRFGFVGGVNGDRARGHNKVGDVPADIGYVEPYAGMYLDFDLFYLTTAVRWNSETNTRFREEDDQEFRRQWLYDMSLGLRLRPVTLSVDLRYHNRYDPEDALKKYLEVAPGLDWHIGSGFHVSVAGIFYTASESKNRGAMIAFRKFID